MNLSQPIDNSGRQIRNILIGFAAILILYILKMTANIMIPLVIALFIFIVVNPVLSRLDKMRIPSFLSMLITLILVVAVFFLFVYIFFVMVNMLLQTDTGLPAYAVRVQQLDRQLSAFIAPYLDEDPVTFSILADLDLEQIHLDHIRCDARSPVSPFHDPGETDDTPEAHGSAPAWKGPEGIADDCEDEQADC